jgi:DeoR/GlpR family transcriptional regulator of sugar metabolism
LPRELNCVGSPRTRRGHEVFHERRRPEAYLGEAAAELVESGMVVGLGTGSTAAWFVKALAARG